MACTVGACGSLAVVINRMEGRGLRKHHVLSIFLRARSLGLSPCC